MQLLKVQTLTPQEFKNCFDNWFEEIRNYITYRCCDGELATDIVQEAYAVVWEKQLDYQGNQTKGLLYKISNELWISQYRKHQTEKKYKMTFSWKEEHNNSEEQLMYNELKSTYEKALTQLPEKRRVVFLMSRMENLTYKEISARLNITTKAVEQRMTLALKELRKVLNHGE